MDLITTGEPMLWEPRGNLAGGAGCQDPGGDLGEIWLGDLAVRTLGEPSGQAYFVLSLKY